MFVAVELDGQKNTYTEQKDGVVYTRNAPFGILVETDKEITVADTTITVPLAYHEGYSASQIVNQFFDYYHNQTTEYDSVYNEEIDKTIFFEKRLLGKIWTSDDWFLIFSSGYDIEMCKLYSKRYAVSAGTTDLYVVASFLQEKGFPYEYIMLENGNYYKIFPRVILQRKNDLNVKDVAVMLKSIKKSYKNIISKIEFKLYGSYGYMYHRTIKFTTEYSYIPQKPMSQFKYLKNCIERGDEKIELDLLYPQTFQFWTDLFIESGLFTSVYLETEELILTNGEDGK